MLREHRLDRVARAHDVGRENGHTLGTQARHVAHGGKHGLMRHLGGAMRRGDGVHLNRRVGLSHPLPRRLIE